jgi:cytosine/adenosine deaminase-related metal-dependent hydrolase
MHLLKNSLVVGVTLLGLGCASSPMPVEQLASAEASVRAARELGAAKVPRAELHLNLAQTQVAQARKLSEDGENEQASVLLTRARADAELAVSLVREAAVYQDLEASGAKPEPSSTTATTPSPTLGGMR